MMGSQQYQQYMLSRHDDHVEELQKEVRRWKYIAGFLFGAGTVSWLMHLF